jgi:hypothetical protein
MAPAETKVPRCARDDKLLADDELFADGKLADGRRVSSDTVARDDN